MIQYGVVPSCSDKGKQRARKEKEGERGWAIEIGGSGREMLGEGERGAQKPFSPLLGSWGGAPVLFKIEARSEERGGGRERCWRG